MNVAGAFMDVNVSTADESHSGSDPRLSLEAGVQHGGARHQSENTVPADGGNRQTCSDGHQGFGQPGEWRDSHVCHSC